MPNFKLIWLNLTCNMRNWSHRVWFIDGNWSFFMLLLLLLCGTNNWVTKSKSESSVLLTWLCLYAYYIAFSLSWLVKYNKLHVLVHVHVHVVSNISMEAWNISDKFVFEIIITPSFKAFTTRVHKLTCTLRVHQIWCTEYIIKLLINPQVVMHWQLPN